MKKGIAHTMMYSCTASSAIWFFIGLSESSNGAFGVGLGFAVLSGLYWIALDD